MSLDIMNCIRCFWCFWFWNQPYIPYHICPNIILHDIFLYWKWRCLSTLSNQWWSIPCRDHVCMLHHWSNHHAVCYSPVCRKSPTHRKPKKSTSSSKPNSGNQLDKSRQSSLFPPIEGASGGVALSNPLAARRISNAFAQVTFLQWCYNVILS